MQLRKLTHSGFISPFIFRNLPSKSVVENQTVSIGDAVFQFADEAYPDGTQVLISCDRDFICVSIEEMEREKEWERQRREAQALERERKVGLRKAENFEFNKSLNIPVQWSPDNKVVMSGLSETSSGNGCYSKTVTHVVLRESLTVGRIRREKGQYLCSQPKAKHSLHATEFWGEKPPQFEDAKVDCKKCLEICARWK